jgi:hypothetical protein
MEHPRKGGSARRARGGILFQRSEERLHDPVGKLGAPLARVGRRLGQVGEADLGDTAARKGRVARERLVEDAAERIHVARAGRLLPLDQFGREVVRRPEELAVGGEASRIRASGKPEVGERCGALTVEEHVRGLDVAVQDAPGVEGVEPTPELGSEVGGLVDPEWPQRPQPQRQRAAGVKRHHQEGAAL